MIQTAKERAVENVLIENYRKYYHLALGYVHNEADALDIVQEGAYKAILKSETLRNEEHAATWIYRIMLNEVFSFCRGKRDFFAENSIGDFSLIFKKNISNFSNARNHIMVFL